MKVKCIDKSYWSDITLGKEYTLLESNMAHKYYIKNDRNHSMRYPKILFELVSEEKQEDIVKPKRYNRKGKLECIEVILDQEMDFLEGNICKYTWRYKDKGGVEDLKKARYYLDKLIEREEKNTIR